MEPLQPTRRSILIIWPSFAELLSITPNTTESAGLSTRAVCVRDPSPAETSDDALFSLSEPDRRRHRRYTISGRSDAMPDAATG